MTPDPTQALLLTALERSPDLVLLVSPEHTVLYANAAATTSFGLGDVVNQPAPDLVDALSREPFLEALRRATYGEPVSVEIILGRPPAACEAVVVPTTTEANPQSLLVVGRRRALAPLVEQRLGELNRRYDEKVRELATLTGKLRELATTDSLTNLFNRRAFMDRAQVEWSRARRHGHPLGVVVLDVDHFKRVNDRYLHATGDEVLKVVAYTLRTTVRSSDIPARLGGEEFVALLPDTAETGAALLAERIRARLAQQQVTAPNGESISVTTSAGVACSDRPFASFPELLAAADAALFKAKADGRDCVRLASQLPPKPA